MSERPGRMIPQPDPLHVIIQCSHTYPYHRSKAELRRQKRGMKFPAPHAMIADMRLYRQGVIVTLTDGTRWRVYMRGGKSFRRKLKPNCQHYCVPIIGGMRVCMDCGFERPADTLGWEEINQLSARWRRPTV
jgi:hypothetical protein